MRMSDWSSDVCSSDLLTMADLVGDQTYRITDISPVLGKPGVRDFFNANRDAFELNEFDTLFDSAVEDYAVSEDVAAGYLLGRWDSDTLRVKIGRAACRERVGQYV